ncbi:MAG: MBL fold metallo-hydrolase [Leptolyngbyaceae cyanobacterium CSU_1_4]|nr:MBL fold metallo-hydrolase [Leptolyngbyaceae cyanobacterium CSU_1_4]
MKTGALAAIATAVPVAWYTAAQAQTSKPRNAGFYRFKLGQFNLATISDGVLAAPAAAFAGDVTPEQLQAVLRQGFQSETLTPDCNILFVDTGTHKVLIDSGNGNLGGDTAGKLLENLALAKISPTDIDTLVITHAHPDHVGGLTDPAGMLLFPNARYYVPSVEWQFWMDSKVSLPKVRMPEEAKQTVIAVAKKQLTAIQDRVTQFKVNQEIIPGMTALSAPGHTPGHVALRIVSGEASLVHTADVVHTHTINLWNPDWQPIFDADPEQAAATRQSLLEKIAIDRTLMFAYHFPFPGVGHITPREAGGFDWEPVSWQFEG